MAILLYVLAAVRLGMFWRNAGSDLKSLVDGLFRLLLVALLVLHFVVRLFYVPSRSMQPTLEVYDGLAANQMRYRLGKPYRGEVVIFRRGKEYLVKRVVAIEGDTVEVRNGRVVLNGAPQEGPHTLGQFAEHRVAPGCFFVMGDNRNNSADSRVFGDVPYSSLVGAVAFRFWPPSRFGLVR